jgi:hypothetical protein
MDSAGSTVRTDTSSMSTGTVLLDNMAVVPLLKWYDACLKHKFYKLLCLSFHGWSSFCKLRAVSTYKKNNNQIQIPISAILILDEAFSLQCGTFFSYSWKRQALDMHNRRLHIE